MQNALLPVHQEESGTTSPANNADLTGTDLAQLRRYAVVFPKIEIREQREWTQETLEQSTT